MRISFLCLLFFAGIQQKSFSQTIYVDSSATGLNNGTSWANAYTSFESALNQTRTIAIDSVLVARGTYKPSQPPPGVIGVTGDRDFTFYFPEGGAFVGGYPSGGGVRNPKVNPTILSGDIGVTGDQNDNTYHVTMFRDCEVDLFDFIISDGLADGTDTLSFGIRKIVRSIGGGAIVDNSIVDLTRGIIKNNMAYNGGGIATIRNSMPILRECILLTNFGFEKGGAVYIDSSIADIEARNCVFQANEAGEQGGALYANGSHGKIYHCTFANNVAYGGFGGAVLTFKVPNFEIRNTLFSNNRSSAIVDPAAPNSDISDEEYSPGVSGLFVSASSLQQFVGDPSCVYSIDGGLLDPADADGADDIFGTNDDGLFPTASSPGFNKGTLGTDAFDIVGTPRNVTGNFAIGAYEFNPCTKITSRVVYVDSAIAGNGHSGNTWNDALNNLQAAINIVVAGCADTIKVAKGTYLPSTTPRGWSSTQLVNPTYSYTFHLPANIVMLGGYGNGGTQRDPDLFPTNLKLSLNGSQVVTVIKSNNITFDGFNIMNGRAEQRFSQLTIDGTNYERIGGGGMFVSESSILVRNCKFLNNLSQQKGGALYAQVSQVKLENTIFDKNRAYDNTSFLSFGGAIYFSSMLAGTYLKKCKLTNNIVHFYGGAMALQGCLNPIVIDSCLFEKNSTQSVGGGTVGGGVIYAIDQSEMVIHNSVFNNNTSYRGGVMNMPSAGNISISQSFFTNNTATHNGGAIYYSALPTKVINISNSLFYNNSAVQGGALELLGKANIYYSNFYRNNASAVGGAIANSFVNEVSVMGTVFWDNQQAGSTIVSGSDIVNTLSPFAGYSFFQSYTNNVSHNTTGIYPEFRDTANVIGPDNTWGTADDGLQLKLNSPLINEIGNDYAGYGFGTDPIDQITDIKGSPRVQDRHPEIAPYETSFCELSGFINRTVYVDSSVNGGNHTGTSWQNAFTDLEDAVRVGRAHCIDTIKVAKGTYMPTATAGYNKYNSPSIDRNLVIPDSIYLMGGYASGGGQRSLADNPTIVKAKNSDRGFWFNSVKNSTIDGFILDSTGVKAEGSELIIKNSVIKRGNVEMSASLFFGSSKAQVINCAFANNNGTFISGTVWQENSSIDYINSVFANNLYNDFGGASAIAIRGNGAANVTNCTFYRNTVINGGTITRFDDAAQLSVKNSLFWNNRYQTFAPDPDINDIWIRTNNPVLFTTSNNLFMNGTPPNPADSSIYGINPGFADTTNLVGADGQWLTPDDGLAISDTSVAINEGNNSFVPAGITTDIAGLIRIANGRVDIGAYEFECTGARGYTNKLVPLGTEETSVNRLLGCGSLRYMESETTPQKYIAFISDNGNTINPTSVTVDATTNLVNFRTNGTDSAMVAYRMVSIIAPGTYTTNGGVRVRIYFDPAEFASLPKGIRSWFKHPAHTQTDVLNDLTFNGLNNAVLITPSSIGTENGIAYVEFSNITSFSTFGFIGLTTQGPLPVNFLSFTAEEGLNNSVLLKWKTGWEKNNDRFEVERSADGVQWKKIGTVKGSGTLFQDASYSFADDAPAHPQSFYRLKQVDQDEKFRYSVVRKVDFNSGNNEFIVGPNPASSQTAIRFSKIQSTVNYEVLDIGGRVKIKGRQQNVKQITIQTAGLENGVYLLKINNFSRKLIISR